MKNYQSQTIYQPALPVLPIPPGQPDHQSIPNTTNYQQPPDQPHNNPIAQTPKAPNHQNPG
jgi:hypothetical protein